MPKTWHCDQLLQSKQGSALPEDLEKEATCGNSQVTTKQLSNNLHSPICANPKLYRTHQLEVLVDFKHCTRRVSGSLALTGWISGLPCESNGPNVYTKGKALTGYAAAGDGIWMLKTASRVPSDCAAAVNPVLTSQEGGIMSCAV